MTTTEKTDDDTSRKLVNTVLILTGIVGAVALVVSSYYLHQYGIGARMKDWLAWSLVAALDVGGAGGSLVWIVSNGPARAWGRAIALSNLTASIVANVLGHLLEAKYLTGGPWMQILTGVVYPAELSAMIHLAFMFRRELTPARPVAVSAVPEAVEPEPVPVPATPKYPTVSTPTEPVVPARPVPAVPVPTLVPAPVPTAPTGYEVTGYIPGPKGALALSPNEITDELLDRAREFRATRAKAGLPRGREVLMQNLDVNDRIARNLIRRLNAEPPVRLVAGAR